ncbi:MAG: alpha/beta hydrolase, partial [Proteobacteria bacterium]|nr:alpha/beta hydrolase [Pseudomonadota bacterium]
RSGFAQANGVRLHYQAAGSGRLVLFLHGFPEFWRCWKRQLEHFGADHLAVAPDMRGYNLSECPADVAQYRAKLLVEDIRQLAAGFTQDKFVLVAHDWGGAVAWSFAIAHPELLSHLIIINSPPPYGFWRELATNPAQQKASDYMLLLRNPKAERVLAENNFERLLKMRFAGREEGPALEADRAAYLKAWSQPGALTGSLNYYRASPLYPPAPGDAGAAKLKLDPKDFVVRVPTLVIWGERDKALLPSILDGIGETVPGVEVVRVPDATHWVMDEKPDLVNAEIRRFISKGRA